MRGLAVGSLLLLSVAQASLAATGVFREQTIPGAPGGATQVVGGYYIYWFTEFDANKIGMLTRDGQFQEFSVPTADSGPHGIALDFNNTIWFTEIKAGKIGKLTAEGVFTEYAIPTPQSAPWGIAILDDGAWFTESAVGKIGRVNADGSISEIPLPAGNSSPRGIARGLYGHPCFAEFGADRIGCLENGQIVERNLAVGSGPTEICSDTNASLWFLETMGNRIGAMNFNTVSSLAQAKLFEYPIPTAASEPGGIVAEFSHGVWFSETAAGQIGFVSSDGRMTEYPLRDRSSQPTGIALSLFGAESLESRANRLTEVKPDTVVVVGAGTSGAWRTKLEISNPLPRSESILASVYPRASDYSFEGGPPGAGAIVSANGSVQINLDSSVANGLYTFHVRDVQEGALPYVRARIFNGGFPSQSADLPTIRLSSLTSLNPSTLIFPGVVRGGRARSNLLIAELSIEDGDFSVGPPRIVSLRVELFDPDGNSVASKTVELVAGRSVYIGDVVGWLGVTSLDLGQIRVTRLEDRDLIWGYAATIDADGAVSIIGGLTP